MEDGSERAVQAAIDGEWRLLAPEARASPVLVSELLEPEFVEFGASGRQWNATSVLTVTSTDSADQDTPIRVCEMSGVALDPVSFL